MTTQCHHRECIKQRSYGVDDDSKKTEYCSQHAKAGMVNVKNRRCLEQGCNKQPSYGVDDGNKKPEYCSQHAKAGMVDVRSKRCAQQGCITRPSYGVDDGSKKPEYCSQHAKAGMVDVRSKRCAQQGCVKHPSYGVDDSSKKREYCLRHAKAGMVNVESKKRAQHGCTTRPSVGISGAHTGESSSQHAKEVVSRAMRGSTAGRDGSGAAEDIGACQPRAAPQRKRLAGLAGLAGVSSSDSDGASSKKQARRADVVPALGVPIKRDEAARLADDAGGPCSQPLRPQPTGGILLRPSPPIRPLAGEGGKAVKTELIVRGPENRE